MPLTGQFKTLIGSPECRGSWFVYGKSGNGKTTFIMQLCKELTKLYKVDYNSLEEEDRASMIDLMDECKMNECRKGKFMLLTGYNLEELYERIQKDRSANIIIIDSIQYFDLNKIKYKKLLADFPNKLFIFNSHADSIIKPKGALAEDILYDADVKIWVEGFTASSRSRMSRGRLTEDYVIWQVGAERYWKNI